MKLLDCCLPAYRTLVATALYTGMRLSELLGLVWDDLDFAHSCIHVRAQLSRAHVGAPVQRLPPKTRAGHREIPLTPQLAGLLGERRLAADRGGAGDWVFATRNGTPLSIYARMFDEARHAADIRARMARAPLRGCLTATKTSAR